MKKLVQTRKPKTKGRYSTRVELCREVWFWYIKTDMNISQVAKLCEVSAATINNILNTKEGYPDGITSG